jgi:NADH-quinone oxidoreductase subunit C
MLSLDQIKLRIEQAVPGSRVEFVPNGAVADQVSLLLDAPHGVECARFLKETPELCFDYASNVTGVDWPDTTVKTKVKKIVDGQETEVEESVVKPGYLEAVYHLYSMTRKHGPLVIRLRTANRTNSVRLPSLTPVWRGAEFQEREIFDLFGIVFDGHPDLRRLLMWDGFQDHPMRKDYVEPDDYEYEPTPHDEVLEKAQSRAAKEANA